MSDAAHTGLAENHERIWLEPLCAVEERSWCEDPQACDECELSPVEYVRADLVAALQAERDRLKDLLRRSLAYMEAAETAGLVGDEGCHWPVEEVRAALST